MRNRQKNSMLEYDYSQDNLYFVTPCVKNMVFTFGKVENQQMRLNKYGEIVKSLWFSLADEYADIKLHAFVVMPNHVHGLLRLVARMLLMKSRK